MPEVARGALSELEPGRSRCGAPLRVLRLLEEEVWRTVITAAQHADQVAELVLRSLDGRLPERIISAGELKGLQREWGVNQSNGIQVRSWPRDSGAAYDGAGQLWL